MSPGDLHWVEFPTRGGHAQAGRRPALVVQSVGATVKLPTVLCIPLTTQLDALRFPCTALVEAIAENGLKRPSVALAFQLTAVDKHFVGPRLGTLSTSVINAIKQAFDEIAPWT